MKKSRLLLNFLRATAALLLAGMLMGTSCASDIRHNLTAGSLDFVQDTAANVAGSILPIADWIAAMLPY
jgi:hypothetical protein